MVYTRRVEGSSVIGGWLGVKNSAVFVEDRRLSGLSTALGMSDQIISHR
jgi:hypothetical protein